jgi:3-hydroxybutyrate dehydrogenase
MMSLKGRTALITGSTSGIGLGIARTLAAEGANIMLNGFGDAAMIEKERVSIEKDFGVRAAYNGADLSKDDQVSIIEDTVAKLGSIDILVNNAGIQHVAPVDEFPVEKWDLIQALMLKSPFLLIRAALPHMKRKNWGRIVNISSAHGKVASAGKSAYVAAKHGLVGLSKVVALETAATGITSNCICPGWVLTPLVQKQVDALAAKDNLSPEQAKLKLLSEKQPSKEFVTPEQIGALAVFLCSEAAAQIRGTEISIDGGWTAQ